MNLKAIAEVMDNLCSQYNSGEFVPLLEADIAGYLYHILLTQKLIALAHIHLDSRVIGAERNQKFDIALGPIEIREDRRPAVGAQVVIEIKSFPRGFTDPQHRVHYFAVWLKLQSKCARTKELVLAVIISETNSERCG